MQRYKKSFAENIFLNKILFKDSRQKGREAVNEKAKIEEKILPTRRRFNR